MIMAETNENIANDGGIVPPNVVKKVENGVNGNVKNIKNIVECSTNGKSKEISIISHTPTHSHKISHTTSSTPNSIASNINHVASKSDVKLKSDSKSSSTSGKESKHRDKHGKWSSFITISCSFIEHTLFFTITLND